MKAVRSPADVEAAKVEAVEFFSTFETGPVTELTKEQALQLSKCTKLQEVLLVLPRGTAWQLVLPSPKVMARLGMKSPLMWACDEKVDWAVMAYFLAQPGMHLPWALEAVSEGVPNYNGVQDGEHPSVGRGITPLLGCLMDGHLPTQLQKCDMLLAKGACLTTRNRTGCTALHVAVQTGSPAATEWAIGRWCAAFPVPGCVDEPMDEYGYTARKRAEFLLERGDAVFAELLALFPEEV
jgi:hypothetical protein